MPYFWCPLHVEPFCCCRSRSSSWQTDGNEFWLQYMWILMQKTTLQRWVLHYMLLDQMLLDNSKTEMKPSYHFSTQKQSLHKWFDIEWNRSEHNWAPKPPPSASSLGSRANKFQWTFPDIFGEDKFVVILGRLQYNGFVEHRESGYRWPETLNETGQVKTEEAATTVWRHPIQWEQDTAIQLLLYYSTAFWSESVRRVELRWSLRIGRGRF